MASSRLPSSYRSTRFLAHLSSSSSSIPPLVTPSRPPHRPLPQARSKPPSTRAHRDDGLPPAIRTLWKEDDFEVASAEYYRRREEEFDETTQTRKMYKDKTEKLRDSIRELWFRFEFVNTMIPQFFKNSAAAHPAQHYDVPSVIGKINQIMFALALDIGNEEVDKDVDAGSLARPATVYKDTIHYVTDTAYMWSAFASILVCVFCVLPVYWGDWQLGREATLGPFEIAATFRAPYLYHPTNPPVKELIKEVGDREVKFGQIVAGGDAGKIGVAKPQHIARIHPSAKGGNVMSLRDSMLSPGSRANTQ